MTISNDIPDEVVEKVAKACAKDEGSNMLEWTPDYQDDEEMASYRETWLKFARCAILAYRAAMREMGIVEVYSDAAIRASQSPPPTPSKPQS